VIALQRLVRGMTPRDLAYFAALSFVVGAVVGVHLALA
jgi:hypothetical protein